MLPGGRLLSAIPQRCICRQSNIGAPLQRMTALMSPAFSPSRMRRATSAAFLVCPATTALDHRRCPLRKRSHRGKRSVRWLRDKAVRTRCCLHAPLPPHQHSSNPKNCAVWRKVGRVLEHIFEGKFIVPSKLHAAGQPRGSWRPRSAKTFRSAKHRQRWQWSL